MRGSYQGRGISIGGSVNGSVVGNDNRNVTITMTGGVDAESLDHLRELIALSRTEIEAARGNAPADSRIQYELQTIEDELADDEPDGETVRSRWKHVLKLLGPLQDIAAVAKTTASILATFGGN
ncbi:MAG: hypothetical protein ACRDRX_20150 [Pseudonocardiaceae bacterium]